MNVGKGVRMLTITINSRLTEKRRNVLKAVYLLSNSLLREWYAMTDRRSSVETCRHSSSCSSNAVAAHHRIHVLQLHCGCRCTHQKCCWPSYVLLTAGDMRSLPLIYPRHIFFIDDSSQLSLGGMCYRGAPSISQIQPPRRPPQWRCRPG